MVLLGLQKFRPLNALISAPAEAIGPAIHEGKEGEQHAEDLGPVDSPQIQLLPLEKR